MATKQNIFIPGSFYHVYNRGNEGKPIFFERDNYLFFLQRLGEYSERNSIEVICYCLMPNYFHLYRDFIGLRSGKLPKVHAILREFDNVLEYKDFVVFYQDKICK